MKTEAIDNTRAMQRGSCGQKKVFDIVNVNASSDVILVCEHASNYMPADKENLGVALDVIASHVAWDPGALAVAKLISSTLDASLVYPTFSRLIYDCNRPPISPDAMPCKSEIYDIPGNMNMSASEHSARVIEFYMPYYNALNDLLVERIEVGRQPVIVTIHSFTPIYFGKKREVDVGIIHDQNPTLSESLFGNCCVEDGYITSLNEPYSAEDGVTHTLAEHAVSKGLQNTMIEIKNDLITDTAGQERVAQFLSVKLQLALSEIAK